MGLAVNKETLLAAAFIWTPLISAAVGMQFINFGTANFTLNVPVGPDTNPPLINVHSPTQSQTCNSSNVSLTFTVSKPSTWFMHDEHGDYVVGYLLWVGYSLDGKKIDEIPDNDGDLLGYINTPRTIDYAVNLTGLSEGPHTLKVGACGQSTYIKDWRHPAEPYQNVVDGYSDTINFTVNTAPPKISILSVKNQTYYSTNITLNFAVNEPVAWIKYSIDGKARVDLIENTTLTLLSYGSHSLTIYAEDTIGSIGESETIHFSIAPFPTTRIIAAIVSVAVVGAGLLVYFRKIRRSTASLSRKQEKVVAAISF
jgi:hypothetical protein